VSAIIGPSVLPFFTVSHFVVVDAVFCTQSFIRFGVFAGSLARLPVPFL
jgi:hypothetical protein